MGYTAAQCRGILANAFLCNIMDTTADMKDQRKSGGLDFTRMIYSTKGVAAHKLACILHYFIVAKHLEGTEDDARVVTIERRVSKLNLEDFYDWAMQAGSELLCEETVATLHNQGMEGIDGTDTFVNFANS